MRYALIALLSAAQPTICLPHDAAKVILEREHREVPVSIALTADDKVMEIFASPEGTWTILVTTPDGVSCIMGTGEGFETLMPGKVT